MYKSNNKDASRHIRGPPFCVSPRTSIGAFCDHCTVAMQTSHSSSPPLESRTIDTEVPREDATDGGRFVMLVLEEVDRYFARVRINAGLLLRQEDLGIPGRMWLLKHTILHLLMRKMVLTQIRWEVFSLKFQIWILVSRVVFVEPIELYGSLQVLQVDR